jgi:hypothetical protein
MSRSKTFEDSNKGGSISFGTNEWLASLEEANMTIVPSLPYEQSNAPLRSEEGHKERFDRLLDEAIKPKPSNDET